MVNHVSMIGAAIGVSVWLAEAPAPLPTPRPAGETATSEAGGGGGDTRASEVPEWTLVTQRVRTEVLIADCHLCSVDDELFESREGGCMDLQTGLVWGTTNLGNGTGQYTYTQAEQLAEESEECGFTDWRLPTLQEAETLFAHGGLDYFTDPTCCIWTTTGQGKKRYRINLVTGESHLVWAGGPAESYGRFIGVREADAGGGGSAMIDCVTYDTSGGPGGDKHLQVTVTVTDDAGSPIGQAGVSITAALDGSPYGSDESSTNDAGQATFSFGNAPAGVYEIDVTDVGPDYDFDGAEPVNAFEKGVDAAPASFGCCGC